MASSLYGIIFGKNHTQRELENKIDELMQKNSVPMYRERQRFPEWHGLPSYSATTYDRVGFCTMFTLMIPEFPQDERGYHSSLNIYSYKKFPPSCDKELKCKIEFIKKLKNELFRLAKETRESI